MLGIAISMGCGRWMSGFIPNYVPNDGKGVDAVIDLTKTTEPLEQNFFDLIYSFKGFNLLKVRKNLRQINFFNYFFTSP